MRDLIFSEWRRFRLIALIAMSFHWLIQLFLNRLVDMLQQPYMVDGLTAAIYGVTGLLLGLYQIGSYRKPNQWLWLIHRPLPPQTIFLALFIAAIGLLMLMVCVPLLFVIIGVDTLTDRVVDSRHYVLVLPASAIAVMGWLVGCYTMLSRYKPAFVVAIIPVAAVFQLISVWAMLLTVAIGGVWLYVITAAQFRANRQRPISQNGQLLLTALPLQMGFFLLLFFVGEMIFETVWMLAGTHPLNTPMPARGGYVESHRAEPGDLMLMGLKNSTLAETDLWREQIPLLQPFVLMPYINRFPIRHQVSNLVVMQWLDEARQIEWTFSHDKMMFHGLDVRSGADKGWFGVNGVDDLQPFDHVPFVVDNTFMLTAKNAYIVEPQAQKLHRVIQLGDDDYFTIPGAEYRDDKLMTVTTQGISLYSSDKAKLSVYAEPLRRWHLPFSDQDNGVLRVDAFEMLDGWLVSVVYGEYYEDKVRKPWQQITFVNESGQSQVIADRVLDPEWPQFVRNAWWLSPVLYNISKAPRAVFDQGYVDSSAFEWRVKEPAFYPVTLALLVVSLLGAAYWLRAMPLSHPYKRWWLLSCALLGLPALFSLLVLHRRGEPT